MGRLRVALAAFISAILAVAGLTLGTGGATAVVAEQVYVANLSPDSEVPPVVSTASGFARVTLNGAQNQVRISLAFTNLTSNQTVSHIHGPGAVGVVAPVAIDIGTVGGTTGWMLNQVRDITPAQVQQLKDGLLYVNIHSANFSAGEIRGQLVPDQSYVANLTGANEFPTNTSTASGFAKVSLSADEKFLFASASWSGLTGTLTGGHLHAPAAPGANAPIQFDLAPSGGATGATNDLYFPVLDPADVTALKDGLMYVNIHSSAFPAGEVRGQLARDTTAPVATMSSPTAAHQTALAFSAGWSASDLNGIAAYDVRVQEATYNGPLADWTTLLSGTESTSTGFTGQQGRTYCFAARAQDKAGNTGAYSASRCTVTPLDDKVLKRIGDWTRPKVKGAFQGRVSQSSSKGSKLVLKGVQAKTVALLVAKAKGSGKVKVKLGKTKVGTFKLSGKKATLVVLPATAFPDVRSGKLTITVASKGKPVRIDGIFAGR